MKKTIIAFILLIAPQITLASNWSDLWLRPDQQGAQALQKGEAKTAAKKFKNPLWKGVADYRAKQYHQAEKSFAGENTALAHYNRGNTLAYLRKYQQAIDAYEQALKLKPDFADAKYNQDLLKKMQQQQNQQQQEQQKDKSKNQQQKQSKQSKSGQSTQDKKQQENNSESRSNASDKNASNKNEQQQRPKQKQQQDTNNKSSQASQQKQDQNSSEQQKKQAQNSNKSTPNEPTKNNSPQQKIQAQQKPNTNQQQQARKQWLRQIPDDPGGLLRQKFLRDHYRNQMKNLN